MPLVSTQPVSASWLHIPTVHFLFIVRRLGSFISLIIINSAMMNIFMYITVVVVVVDDLFFGVSPSHFQGME